MKSNVQVASKRGYKTDGSGRVVSPLGNELKVFTGVNNNYYPRFSIRHLGRYLTIPVHRLAAYEKYGEAIFDSKVVVRHLDGNKTNNHYGNLALGSHLDNHMDMTPEQRSARSVNGGKATGGWNKKLSREEIFEILSLREGGVSVATIAEEYNTSKTTVGYIWHGKVYKEWVNEYFAK